MIDLTIRPAKTPADYHALQRAQRLAWGIADDSLVLPTASMVGAQHFGGLVLGAYTSEGEAVALSFAFLARNRGRIVLYSQLTGVVPRYQSLGIGQRLKEAQRAFCRGEGIAAIVWAFDPFQPGNARFNLNRLGATCREFVEDMYGPRDDALNAGVPTDRLIAEWEVEAVPRPPDHSMLQAAIPRLIHWDRGVPEFARHEGSTLLIEIPESMSALRRSDSSRATSWRAAVRSAFADSFGRGYTATAFTRIVDPQTGELRSYYVMLQGKQGKLPRD